MGMDDYFNEDEGTNTQEYGSGKTRLLFSVAVLPQPKSQGAWEKSQTGNWNNTSEETEPLYGRNELDWK